MRVRLFQALVRSTTWPSNAEIEALLEDTLRYAVVRNQLAQNPRFADVHVAASTGDIDFRPVIRDAEKVHSLDHIALANLNAQLEAFGKHSPRLSEAHQRWPNGRVDRTEAPVDAEKAYSDDQIYLELRVELVNSHEVESVTRDRIKYSSSARLWAG